MAPHPPAGAQGAPPGQSAGSMALPPQGVQPHAMAAQPMNQQWMGNPTGSQGCPGTSPTLGPTSFFGPGHPGQGFVVQYKHHQGCYSSMQHQQPMLGSTSSSSPSPMGFGPGSQQAGYQGTTWSSFPTPTPMTQQVPQQHQLDATSNPQGHNPGTHSSPTPTFFVYKFPAPAKPTLPAPAKDLAFRPPYPWLPVNWLQVFKVYKANQLFRFLNFLKVPLVLKVLQALQFDKVLKLPKANKPTKSLKLPKILLKVLLPSKEHLRHRRVETNLQTWCHLTWTLWNNAWVQPLRKALHH